MTRTCACGAPITRKSKTGKCLVCVNGEWPQSEVEALCDLIADGSTFPQVAEALGRTKTAVVSRWRKVVRSMGAQAA